MAIWTAKPRPVGHRPPPRSFLALTRPRDATDACPPRTRGNWKWYSTYTPRVAFLFRFSIYPSAFLPLTNSFLSTPNKLIKIISRQNRPRRRAGLAYFSSASLPCRVSRLLPLRRPVRAAKPELNLTCLTPIIHFRSIPLLKGAWLGPNYIDLPAHNLMHLPSRLFSTCIFPLILPSDRKSAILCM